MRWLVITGCVLLSACSSDNSDSPGGLEGTGTGSTSNIISVNGSSIPDNADLALIWGRPPDNNDQSWDSFITRGGEVAGESALIDPPAVIPPQVVSDGFGIAVAFLVAYPTGIAPEAREYASDENLPLDNAIGIANTHAIIYKSHDLRPDAAPPGFEFWGDLFPLGYSCALSIDGGNDGIEEQFDFFEPVDCSEVELRIGVVSEIELTGFDWF